ncbi:MULTISPECIES: hypothetical protein [Aeromonas]|uniref:hypothetical protein n=1 Tax=Aeromonas TaxID=642 RepID=UPI002B240488|nr:hypothetical protein [Aeromonas veronii]
MIFGQKGSDTLIGSLGEGILILGSDTMIGGADCNAWKWIAGNTDGSTYTVTDFTLGHLPAAEMYLICLICWLAYQHGRKTKIWR